MYISIYMYILCLDDLDDIDDIDDIDNLRW